MGFGESELPGWSRSVAGVGAGDEGRCTRDRRLARPVDERHVSDPRRSRRRPHPVGPPRSNSPDRNAKSSTAMASQDPSKLRQIDAVVAIG